jgi:hypothetical protein
MSYSQRLCFSLDKRLLLILAFGCIGRCRCTARKICHDLAKSGYAFRAEYLQYKLQDPG